MERCGIEKKELCNYIKPRPTRTTLDGSEISIYICNRRGKYTTIILYILIYNVFMENTTRGVVDKWFLQGVQVLQTVQ